MSGKSSDRNQLKQLAQIATDAGWTVTPTRKGHLAWRGPEGQIMHSGATPSDWRALRNIKARLRREGLEVPR